MDCVSPPEGYSTDTSADGATHENHFGSGRTAGVMSFAARTGLFTICTACLIVGSLDVARALVELSRNDSASHVVVIPFVTLALIYRRRTWIFSRVRFDWRAGFGVILLGLLGLLGALRNPPLVQQQDALTLRVTALVILWIGGFLLFYGRRAFRAALFPLLFLGFAIPLPGVLLNWTTRVLTTGSSETVAGLFMLTGTPYHRDGFVFSLPNLAIEIADECSGIRSSIALVLTGLIAAHIYLKTARSTVLVVAAILPVTLLKNGIRIVSISLLSIHVDPAFLTGWLHHQGGIVFFLLALALLVPVFVVLRRTETTAMTEISPSCAAGRVD
jgi:exosortase